MAHRAEVTVMASAAFKEVYLELVPEFERRTGHRVTTLWVPSVDMMKRLKAGEVVDLVFLSASAIDELIEAGRIARGGRVDLARSGIGAAVRSGAPKPDISSGEALKRTLLEAKSIVYSTGPSGVYVAGLLERMGIADRVKSRITIVQGEPAGAVIARGEADIGFQQICELLPVPGIDLVGPLPADVQKITVFSVGLHADAREPAAAGELMRFLTAPDAAPVIREKGMEPV